MIRIATLLLFSTCLAFAGPQADVVAPKTNSNLPGYLLGPEDQIQIHVEDMDDIPDRPIRIDPGGNIDLSLIGSIHVAGKTTTGLRQELIVLLRKYVVAPRVTVTVTEFRSKPVSVLGSVNNPGVRQVEGPRTLLEMISLSGGLRPDAGSTLTISRPKESGPLPLKGTRTLLDGGSSVSTFDVARLMSAKDPEENIQILPYDVINVSSAETISVMGEVKKPGTFTLHPHEGITVLQALALAEGPQKTAAQKNAFIIRVQNEGRTSTHIAADLSAITDGKKPDFRLEARDILVVPNNAPRNATLRGLETAIQIGTGILIFHH